MDKIHKVVVALDASHMDKTLIPYTKFLLEKFPVQKLYFISVIKNLNVPDEILKQHPDFVEKSIHDLEQTIRKEVKKNCKDCEVDTEFIIKTDRKTQFIMEFAHENDIDLIVLGRKLTIPSSGVTIPRLTRRANTNLLIVPEGAQMVANRLHVPIDFSVHCRIALQHAYDLAAQSNNPEIICHHVYHVPNGYRYTGKSKKEFGDIMKANAEKAFNRMLKSIQKPDKDVALKIVYDMDKNDDLTSDIRESASKFGADWVIIGAKGRTSTAALFIGSFAEKLIATLADKPIFVARPKGGNTGLIDYLKEL